MYTLVVQSCLSLFTLSVSQQTGKYLWMHKHCVRVSVSQPIIPFSEQSEDFHSESVPTCEDVGGQLLAWTGMNVRGGI